MRMWPVGLGHRLKYAPQMGITALVLALYLDWTISAAARELRGSEGASRMFGTETYRKSNDPSVEAGLDMKPAHLCRRQW